MNVVIKTRDVQVSEISGKSGEGLDHLIENLLIQAELLELQSCSDGPAEAMVSVVLLFCMFLLLLLLLLLLLMLFCLLLLLLLLLLLMLFCFYYYY